MSIKEVFDAECQHVDVNRKLFKKIIELEAHFVNKKQEHIEFFGGNLIGVQRVRFTAEDRDKLFIDILETDDGLLQERLYALRTTSGVPVINPEYKISSDIFNLSVVWLLHAIHHSRYLSNEEKQAAKVSLCLYMIYKFTTSWLAHSFKYPADPEIAAAAYAQLSFKFILKQTGSWGATLRVLATNAVSSEGIHARCIERMDEGIDQGILNPVVNMLNDVKGRVNDMLKNIYGVLVQTKNQGIRVSRSSSLVETDGELILKDKSKSLGNYTRYLKTVVTDENSFVRQELVEVIASIMHTMPEKLLLLSLKWASQNYGHTKEQTVERAIDLISEHAFEYLSTNKALVSAKGDLAGLISKLRGAYMSSRSSDVKLLEIRELVESIVFQATKSKNESVIASTRTGFMIYVVVRMFSMRHYTS